MRLFSSKRLFSACTGLKTTLFPTSPCSSSYTSPCRFITRPPAFSHSIYMVCTYRHPCYVCTLNFSHISVLVCRLTTAPTSPTITEPTKWPRLEGTHNIKKLRDGCIYLAMGHKLDSPDVVVNM